MTETKLKKIKLGTNRSYTVIRSITCGNRYTSMTSLHKKLQLLKLDDVYNFELGKLMFQWVKKMCRKYFMNRSQRLIKFIITTQEIMKKQFTFYRV